MFSEGSSPSSSPVDAAAADPAAMYAAAAAAAGFRGLLGCSAAAAAPPPFPQVQYFAGNGQDKPPTAMAFHSKDNFSGFISDEIRRIRTYSWLQLAIFRI